MVSQPSRAGTPRNYRKTTRLSILITGVCQCVHSVTYGLILGYAVEESAASFILACELSDMICIYPSD